MSKIRIVFLGTPDFATHALKSLYEDEHFEIAGVVTQPDRPSGRKLALTPSPVKKFAKEKGLKVFTPENINTEDSLNKIESLGGEAAVVVAYGQILTQNFLDLFNDRVVNVHVSLLPRWRGAAPIQRAILADDKEIGVALQKIVKKLDAGDVLGIRVLSLQNDLDALEVLEKMKPLAAELLQIEFMDYLRGNLVGQAQDEKCVTYAKKIEKSEAEIHWKNSARQIFNHVRAMVMGPGSFTTYLGKRLKLIKVRVKSEMGVHKPGLVLEISSTNMIIGCGEGTLEVLEVQPESRSRMSIGEFLKGYNLKKGDHFG